MKDEEGKTEKQFAANYRSQKKDTAEPTPQLTRGQTEAWTPEEEASFQAIMTAWQTARRQAQDVHGDRALFQKVADRVLKELDSLIPRKLASTDKSAGGGSQAR